MIKRVNTLELIDDCTALMIPFMNFRSNKLAKTWSLAARKRWLYIILAKDWYYDQTTTESRLKEKFASSFIAITEFTSSSFKERG